MAQYMVDTSALVKYYHPEIGSPRVIALADDPRNVLFISRIGLVEIHSALARKVRTGELQDRLFNRLSGASMPTCTGESSASSNPLQCMSSRPFVF